MLCYTQDDANANEGMLQLEISTRCNLINLRYLTKMFKPKVKDQTFCYFLLFEDILKGVLSFLIESVKIFEDISVKCFHLFDNALHFFDIFPITFSITPVLSWNIIKIKCWLLLLKARDTEIFSVLVIIFWIMTKTYQRQAAIWAQIAAPPSTSNNHSIQSYPIEKCFLY